MPKSQKVLNVILAVGCAYEVIALIHSRLPTVTRILKTLGAKHPAGRAVLWLWCGYISWHFLEPMTDA